MSDDSRGIMVQQGNIMRINNALVEKTFCSDDFSEGYIIISYSVPEENNTVSIQNIRLNISENTVILNPFGQCMCVCCIQEGMWVDVVFSARMTRSIPPQSSALLIIVQSRPQPASLTTTGRVAFVDTENNSLYTGNPNDINSQTRYIVSDTAVITNRFGIPVGLNALRPGQTVRITHAAFQTASIPPQTTAFAIRVL